MAASASPTNQKTAVALLSYGGQVIHLKAERVSLTDMWKAAGRPANRDPAQWLRSADAGRFMIVLAEILEMGNSHIGHHVANVGDTYFGLVHTTKGGSTRGVTWAHC